MEGLHGTTTLWHEAKNDLRCNKGLSTQGITNDEVWVSAGRGFHGIRLSIFLGRDENFRYNTPFALPPVAEQRDGPVLAFGKVAL